MSPDLMADPTEPPNYLESLDVTDSTASSIQIAWKPAQEIASHLDYFLIHYQKVASSYVQYSAKLYPPASSFNIKNLVADTYYKVCLVIRCQNTTTEFRECIDASTTNWNLPVSIGSSIGAVLALSVVVLIVILSRCPIHLTRKLRRQKKNSKKVFYYVPSHYDDHYEFSETVTQGHDDDLPSEIDRDSLAWDNMSMPLHEQRTATRDRESRLCNGNKNHILSVQPSTPQQKDSSLAPSAKHSHNPPLHSHRHPHKHSHIHSHLQRTDSEGGRVMPSQSQRIRAHLQRANSAASEPTPMRTSVTEDSLEPRSTYAAHTGSVASTEPLEMTSTQKGLIAVGGGILEEHSV